MFLFFLACTNNLNKIELGPAAHHDIHCHQGDNVYDYNVIDAWSRDDQWVLRLSALPEGEQPESRNPWVILKSVNGLCHMGQSETCNMNLVSQ
jgi:hypothetical protein